MPPPSKSIAKGDTSMTSMLEVPQPKSKDAVEYESLIEYGKRFEAAQKEIEKDLYPKLVKIPKDDICIELVCKRNASHLRFEETAPAFTKNTLKFYSSNRWSVLRRNYEYLASNTELDPSDVKIASLVSHDYEIDKDQENSSIASIDSKENRPSSPITKIPLSFRGGTSTPISTKDSASVIDEALEFLQYQSGKSESEVEVRRQVDRHDFVEIYLDSEMRPKNIQREAVFEGNPYEDMVGSTNICITLNNLSFEFCNDEPLFGALALYELNSRKKISENFYFHVNVDKFADLLPLYKSTPMQKDGKNLWQMNFSIPAQSDDIYAIVRIERVLEGDLSTLLDKYIANKGKVPTEDQIREGCRLGKYRQPFAWSAIPIFPNGNNFRSNDELSHSETRMGGLLKLEDDKSSDADLCELALLFQKGQLIKKSKGIPGNIKFKLEHIPEVDHESSPTLNVDALTTRTAVAFPLHPSFIPFTSYINDIFIYPTSLNMSRLNQGRNIWCKIQVASVADLAAASIQKVIHSKYSQLLVDQSDTSVTYHSKNTDYYDETRVSLPINVANMDQYHLLFTFYHIACKERKDKETQTEIGKAFLPIIDPERGTLVNGEYNLPVAQTLCANYLNEEMSDAVKWLDNKKPIFKLKIKAMSTVFPQDPHVFSFFQLAQTTPYDNTKLETAVSALSEATDEELASYCPVILDTLFEIMSRTETSEWVCARAFKSLLTVIQTMCLNVADPVGKNTIKAYIKYQFQNDLTKTILVHETLLFHWSQLTKTEVSTWILHAWFLFEIVGKSIMQLLSSKKSVDLSLPTKSSHLKPQVVQDIQIIINACSAEILNKANSGVVGARRLNESLAYFFIDCFRFLDTDSVFDLIHRHVISFEGQDNAQILELKFDFLTIIGNFEHFVPLNLPLNSYMQTNVPKISSTLVEYWKRHFLVGLILNEVKKSLKHDNEHVRLQSLQLLKNLLFKHNLDERYGHEAFRSRIYAMYWPFILIACDYSKRLPNVTEVERKTILISFWQIIKNIPKDMLLKWLTKDDSPRHQSFYHILNLSLDNFEYIGRHHMQERLNNTPYSSFSLTQDTKRAFEEMYSRKSSAAPQSQSKAFAQSIKYRQSHHKSMTGTSVKSWGSVPTNLPVSGSPISNAVLSPDYFKSPPFDITIASKLAGILGTEVTLIILDTLSAITNNVGVDLVGKISDKSVVGLEVQNIFSVYTRILEGSQSQIALGHSFASVKCFINKFASYIFESQSSLCADICRLHLQYCCSSLPKVKELSAAILYLMMKKNYLERNGNISKVRIQASVALSKLKIKDDKPITQGFNMIRSLMEKDNTSTTRLRQLVTDFMNHLTSLARDSARISMYKYDPDMVTDMYFQIANSYVGNSPDLRLANLEALANIHAAADSNCEAAFCTLQGCKLISDYLVMTKKVDYEDFYVKSIWRKCSKNLEVQEIPDFSILSEEGVCQSAAFSKENLLASFEKAIQFLTKASMHENAIEVSKLITFLYEQNRSFHECARIHGVMKEGFDKIFESLHSVKRIAGTYYRVTFFGILLEQLDSQEYVYKEKPYTSLPEICERLSNCYRSKFGDAFKLLTDSGRIDRKNLAADKVYIQITACEPFFTTEIQHTRGSAFEKSTNVNQFLFETPFTSSGKAHGGVADQFKRKTVITTERSFPDLKRRLLVTSRREFEFTPIEVAIEALHDRCVKLRNAISAPNPEAKSVQLLLQGSVRLQVNSGSMEYARVFLDEKNRSLYRPEQIQRLIAEFREFVGLCGQALVLNRQKLIKDDQIQYQEDLEEGFEELKVGLEPYLKEIEGKSNVNEIFDFLHNTVKARKASMDDETILKTFFGF